MGGTNRPTSIPRHIRPFSMSNARPSGLGFPSLLLIHLLHDSLLYSVTDLLGFRGVSMTPHRPDGMLKEVIRGFDTPAFARRNALLVSESQR